MTGGAPAGAGRGSPNPLDLLRWTFRRREGDVVRMYDYLSGVMRLATGGDMLNFGYWEGGGAAPGASPAAAQGALCGMVGRMAGLSPGQVAVDAGSGYGSPAAAWRRESGAARVVCVNTSAAQLRGSGPAPGVSPVNATATALPLRGGSADAVLAFESAQHFRPLGRFASEARRVLRDGGALVVAIPVVSDEGGEAARLGLLLSLAWTSEHYATGRVLSCLEDAGFEVAERRMIGAMVYGPMAEYYASNRRALRKKITREYPGYVEEILHRSMGRMAAASRDGAIDYLVAACRKLPAGRA